MNKKALFIAALSALVIAPVAQAKLYTLTIKNGTSGIVEAFYASPPGVTEWEEDLLGDVAIGAKRSHKVEFTDTRKGCQYDVRFEFRNNSFEPLEDTINLCEVKEYEITQ